MLGMSAAATCGPAMAIVAARAIFSAHTLLSRELDRKVAISMPTPLYQAVERVRRPFQGNPPGEHAH